MLVLGALIPEFGLTALRTEWPTSGIAPPDHKERPTSFATRKSDGFQLISSIAPVDRSSSWKKRFVVHYSIKILFDFLINQYLYHWKSDMRV